jgi:hypothetical protein
MREIDWNCVEGWGGLTIEGWEGLIEQDFGYIETDPGY